MTRSVTEAAQSPTESVCEISRLWTRNQGRIYSRAGNWSRRERKRTADLAWAESHSDLSAALPIPREEARALLALVQGRNGGTEKAIQEVREWIAVPPDAMRALRVYCRKHPEDREGIERVLHFRRRVAEEFEKLVAGGAELGFNSGGTGLKVV